MSKAWYKHYPSDWRSDKKLRLVSRAARSFWLDCVGVMHQEGTWRLEVNGRPMTIKELADVFGDNPRTAKKLLNELIEFNVCTVDSGGFVISRRVLRDFKKDEQDKSNGRMGGNPSLKTREKDDLGVNLEVKAKIPEPEPDKESLTDSCNSDLQEAVNIYNRYSKQNGWSLCAKFTKPRQARIRARLKDAGGLDGWIAALDRVTQSPFLMGQTKESFIMGLDFIVQESSFTKLMEGKYDGRKKHNGQLNGNQKQTGMANDPALEQIARLTGFGPTSG